MKYLKLKRISARKAVVMKIALQELANHMTNERDEFDYDDNRKARLTVAINDCKDLVKMISREMKSYYANFSQEELEENKNEVT